MASCRDPSAGSKSVEQAERRATRRTAQHVTDAVSSNELVIKLVASILDRNLNGILKAPTRAWARGSPGESLFCISCMDWHYRRTLNVTCHDLQPNVQALAYIMCIWPHVRMEHGTNCCRKRSISFHRSRIGFEFILKGQEKHGKEVKRWRLSGSPIANP